MEQRVDVFRLVLWLCLVGCLAFPALGYCADADAGLNSVTDHVMKIVFGPGVKKSLMVLSAAWGVFQGVSSGSFKPILLWGGIGLSIAYVPKLIEIISNLG